MASGERTGQRGYLRLKEDFLAAFPWKESNLTRDGFRIWARSRRIPPVHIGMHKWRPMRSGEPVPVVMVEAFSEYITDVLKIGRYPILSIAAPCQPDAKADGEVSPREPYAWDLGWAGLFTFVARQFSLPDESYCQNEADIDLAATIILRWVGAQIDKSATASSAIAAAERFMARRRDDYAQFLLMLWKANEHAVLFAVQRDGGAQARFAVTVVAPVMAEFYRRFRSGEAEDSDIQPSDLVSQSFYLLVDACCEDMGMDARQGRTRRSMTLVRTILYQYSALWSPLHKAGANPRVISFAGTPESEKRLRAYSYRPVGAKTRLTGKPVLEFAPPSIRGSGAQYPRDLGNYLAMKSIGLLYQAAMAGQRERLED